MKTKSTLYHLPKFLFAPAFWLCMFLIPNGMSQVNAQKVYAVTSGLNLVSFEAASPGTITSSVPLTGLLANHTFEGLDFRPANGQLYAFSYHSTTGAAQVYRIKPGSGTMTPIGNTITLATGMSSIGFDFNPTVDRIRLTSATRQNYRLNPNDGSLAATDGTLTYAAGDPNAGATPNIRGVAYSNNLPSVTTTAIYYYDFNLNTLSTSSAPNAGTMNTIGSSGIVAASTSAIDMDIYTSTGTGTNSAYLLAGTSGSNSNFYRLNLSTGAATLVGMIGSGLDIIDIAVMVDPTPVNKLIYGLSGNNLVTFFSNTPNTFTSSMMISGITAGQAIVGLDFRPATGQLFAMGYNSSNGATQLYVLNTSTGAATAVAAPVTLATGMTGIGFDFNPTVDRIRVTSDQRHNYRLNPNNGAIGATDGTLTYAPGDPNASAMPAVHAVAYTNSFSGATTTAIYYYDINLNILATSSAPNDGTMNTVGSTGITANVSAMIDMDISSNRAAATNNAFLVASTNGTSSNLYSINLATGATRQIGQVGMSGLVSNIAVYIAPPPPSKLVYALSGSNLVSFNANMPGTIVSSVAVTGIAAGQTLVGIDFRPANGQLFGMGYASSGATQLYLINPATGAATTVGSAIMLAAGMTDIGFDFNPTVDRIRVTSSSRKNYRLNPNDGALAGTDTDLSYDAADTNRLVAPDIRAVAYTNSVAGATSTTIYYYDYSLDALATSASPNGGVLTTIGSTAVNTTTSMGLDMDVYTDVATMMNTAFLSATNSAGMSNFYTLNLQTGEATLVGTIGGMPISDFAVSSMDAPLPVTLAEFKLEKVGRSSRLSWITQTEINNDHFIIERSTNGVDFTAISGVIRSKAVNGNSTQQISYEYNDLAPVKGANFYRLLQVDKDGTKKTSRVLQAVFDDVVPVKVFPNPTRGELNVTAIFDVGTVVSSRLVDGSGKVIFVKQEKVSSGTMSNRFDLSSLPAGVYYLLVLDGENVIHRQTVQKQ
ncbi:DUF4394 domain-containing protein [Aridibaculum aurantiacum]|uniref:DUF4394 domain-containing protein n=1 Tax=Aridibaculum aurantiacum TaxID=2810307 RepID=UPI001A9669A0|nr:DUF4394 domain-containing protein [Aridibaculum aurantiacum]